MGVVTTTGPKPTDLSNGTFAPPRIADDGTRSDPERAPLLGEAGIRVKNGQGETEDTGIGKGSATHNGNTTWQHETRVIGSYSVPLIITLVLQYSLTMTSIVAVGHIGSAELAAVSLATMTANITGYAVYQGLATSLDTLCPQAYGSNNKHLVGVYVQRMVVFFWALSIPIGILWLFAEKIIAVLVPDAAVASLAGLYLSLLVWGIPGYATFEAAKRFVQAQGLFNAPLYVLLFCAPVNALLNWLLVWRLNLGFVGAPIAVSITHTLLPLALLVYISCHRPALSCWNGVGRKAFGHWGPMIKLALPGLLMLEAEVVAFEILTILASRFGIEALAAQSVLGTLSSLALQVPFPLSIAGSTRVAHHIGAALPRHARISARVTFCLAVIVGAMNMTVLSTFRYPIIRLFTSDPEVTQIVSHTLPVVAAFQLFDALATTCNGVLRGLGRQAIGGYVQLFCYYIIGLPVSFGVGFALRWGVSGLWTGVALALALVGLIEGSYIFNVDWHRCVEEAQRRNEGEDNAD